MKIKRYTAKSMREAIKLVREEQGPDAVILSNRRVPEGIEVVSATDYDAALIQQALRNDTREAILPVENAEPPKPMVAEKVVEKPQPVIARPEPVRPAAVATPAPAAAPAPAPIARLPATPIASATIATIATEDKSYLELKRELSSMRNILEEQMRTMVWDRMQSKQPRRVAVLRSLVNLGVAPILAREIINELPHDATDDHARVLPLGSLARRIPVTKPDDIMEGGVIALVGATGVGKTTTVAKIAARFAARHGTRDLALVTTDTYRIGAQEQLHTYGRLIGVPVHTARNGAELTTILQRLSDRKLVLIDTAGLAPRDQKLAGQLEALSKAGNVRSYLVMSASSQTGDLDQAVQRFGTAPLSGCVLTKLDEASRIGGALTTAIRHNLPIAYVCDGQRVPEDLHLARPYNLVVRAQQTAQQIHASVDDDTLAIQFGATNVAA